MYTIPLKGFIARNPDEEVQTLLLEYSKLIEEAVNFGSHIIDHILSSQNNRYETLTLALFFRKYLENLDACSILIKESSVVPSQNILRTAFENILSIEYILSDRSENRCKAFFVWNAFEKEKIVNKCDGKSDEYKVLELAYKRSELFKYEKPTVIKDIEEVRRKNRVLLESDEYRLEVEEYNRLKSEKRGQFPWYALHNGPRDIQQLARKVGYEVHYEILYRSLSKTIHGNDILEGNLATNEEGFAQLYQVRLPFEAETVVGLCINLSISIFMSYYKKRNTLNYSDFINWYEHNRNHFEVVTTKRILNKDNNE